MNKQLQAFARKTLKEGLAQLNIESQLLFKRMYAKGKLELTINDVIDRMDESKLDWAMEQVRRTLEKELKMK